MPQIQQPSNQIKLTNVSVVRLKKGGKRFEIACYKNKVQEWRTGVETNLDDVLQINNVFTNVSKGEVAKHGDLQKAFGKIQLSDVVKEILNKGEVQVGEKERDHDLVSLRKEIATLVAEKCVDPATQRPYPVGMVEKAMAEAGYSIKQNKNAKSQVSECIKLLQSDSNLPIQRARMRIKVSLPIADADKLRQKILESAEKVEQNETRETDWESTMLIDPGQFRVINELLQKECKGRGRLETLAFAATAGPSAS
ncbi:Shwachman-Bodian-diamond syndrome protein [Pholiota conissans]|uniref:Ribosome maturation protein SDO1 n=1 Tax=Pholiota conissans TaxID=109636 RepID=A0A9P6CSX3_9AGAR|nr:Shwachman-Bodian-diamond syndrome protein [Pholiota conissans]